MKITSDDLFRLIKSLDTQEKVFFKVYSVKKGSDKNSLSYLKLFDAIDKLKIYHESLLIDKLKKIGFKHHLKQAKSYLTEAIFTGLEEYHSNSSVNAQLQKLLHRAELLIQKKLTGLATKILMKADKLATEYEVYDYMPAIYSLKEDVLRSTRNIQDRKDYLNHGALKEKEYLMRLKNRTEFKNLLSQILLIADTNSAKAQVSEIGKINSILSSPLLSSPDKALTFYSLNDYYLIHHYCSSLLDKWDDVTYQRQKEWVTYLESDKIKLVERSYAYLSALLNFMVAQIKMGRMDEANKSYKKIQQFYFSLKPKKRTKSIFAHFIGGSFNYMAIYLIKGDPEKSIKTWKEIQGFVSFNQINPSFFVSICSNLSYGYFMLGNYHEALKWLNKVLNFREKNMLEVQAMARIYALLVHYELDNYDMLPYIAKSSQRFLIKHNYFSEFEKIMVNFFEKKIHKTNTQQKQTEAFRQLKKQLEALLKNTRQIQSLEYFDYISWIESKIQNRPFVEIVREKAEIC